MQVHPAHEIFHRPVSFHALHPSVKWQLKKTGLGGIFELVASPVAPPSVHTPLPLVGEISPYHASSSSPGNQYLVQLPAEKLKDGMEEAQLPTYTCARESMQESLGGAGGEPSEQVLQGQAGKSRGQKNLAKMRAAVVMAGPGLHANARIEARKTKEEKTKTKVDKSSLLV